MQNLTARPELSTPLHPLITWGRDTGNSHYVIARRYGLNDGDESSRLDRARLGVDLQAAPGFFADMEVTALKLESGEVLKRGGGAARKNSSKDEMDAGTLQKSKQRARAQVRRKCFSAGIDRMMTLTFKENVTDLREAWDVFKYFSKLMRWRYKARWFYVAVPEFQKRGAVHFHLAVNGFFHANTVRRFWQQAAGLRGGNIDITSPRRIGKASWNPRRIAQYLAKYITKNETVGFNQRRYSSGGDIPEPDVVRGWLAWGMPLHRLFRDVVQEFTRKDLAVIFEADDMRGLFYCST